jgi:histidine ammonia-lyase
MRLRIRTNGLTFLISGKVRRKNPMADFIEVSAESLSIEDVADVVFSGKQVRLSNGAAWLKKIHAGSDFLQSLVDNQQVVYGVTTGFGDSVSNVVSAELVQELPKHLVRFHGVGLGQKISIPVARAILLVRLCSLARGHSGVRLEILQGLVDLLNSNIIPIIPEEGSVGASGDLTPLSYIAAVLTGERKVYADGGEHAAAAALKKAGLQALVLKPKEALALMNGTAVMTAQTILAFRRAEYLSKLCARITSLAVIALDGNPDHFADELFQVKPHPGQNEIARIIRADLAGMTSGHRLQDRYSIRCAPHIIGVLADSLPWLRQFITTELNSANDNPIINVELKSVLHGGHFYGGHIGFAADSMKTLVANLADLMDRQLALLVDTKFNNGLPANLSGAAPERRHINHGFKAVQIAVSAWTAEALKLTMPASVFSRSTECHNQDKVSMGSIGARECLRVLQLTEQVAAALLLATVQAVALRKGDSGTENLSRPVQGTIHEIRSRFKFLTEDRELDWELEELTRLIQDQELPLEFG